MATINYYCALGQIMAQETVGGSRNNYGSDRLGSVSATFDSSGSLQNSYAYSPYGNVVQKVGLAADPKFLWIGALGYRQTGRSSAERYVRARHMSANEGVWIMRDPLWPDTSSYGYASGAPLSFVDPAGLQGQDANCRGGVQFIQFKSNESFNSFGITLGLPSKVSVSQDQCSYVDWYMGLGQPEAGISFGSQYGLFKSFINCGGGNKVDGRPGMYALGQNVVLYLSQSSEGKVLLSTVSGLTTIEVLALGTCSIPSGGAKIRLTMGSCKCGCDCSCNKNLSNCWDLCHSTASWSGPQSYQTLGSFNHWAPVTVTGATNWFVGSPPRQVASNNYLLTSAGPPPSALLSKDFVCPDRFCLF